MADKKQNESKFMAMLERRGIVRKVDSEEAAAEALAESNRLRADADLRSLLELSADDSANVRVSPQPVPGMSKPVFPTDWSASSQASQKVPPERKQVSSEPKPGDIPPLQSRLQPLQPQPQMQTQQPQTQQQPQPPQPQATAQPMREVPPPAPAGTPEQPKPTIPAEPAAAMQQPITLSTQKSRRLFTNDLTSLEPALSDDQRAAASSSPISWAEPRKPSEPPAENHTERYLNINELYDVLSLKSNRTDTIYLIEEYLETLPDSLPEDSRRDIVSKIVSASGFDFDLLMGDGVLRVRMLREYAEKFARFTEDYIAARQSELDALDKEIAAIRKLIEKRRELHKKQFLVIEAEAQRLKDVLAFIAK